VVNNKIYVWLESQIDYETFSHNGITHILYISYRSILVLYIPVATHGHSTSIDISKYSVVVVEEIVSSNLTGHKNT
jgi:hypothetical protein